MVTADAETPRDLYRRVLGQGSSLERTAAFSDAIFAIAMTLLVLDVKVPDVDGPLSASALLGVLPEYLTFVLSFVVIGIVWMSHHRKFRVIRRHDQPLLRLNLLVLLFVASLPFPTALLGRHGDERMPVIVYAVSIALVGLSMALLWWYACRRGLVDEEVTRALARRVALVTLIIPAAFLVSIPVTLMAGATAGEITWALSAPLYLLASLGDRTRSGTSPRTRTRRPTTPEGTP